MQLTHNDGSIVHLQRDNRNRRPTVKIWIDGVDNGEWLTPASFGNIHTRSTQRNVNEWFNGHQDPIWHRCIQRLVRELIDDTQPRKIRQQDRPRNDTATQKQFERVGES